jgi:uncharacterized protein (TIGR00725 family)
MGRDDQAATAKTGEEPVDRELLEHYLAGGGEKLAALEAALTAARNGQAGARDLLRRALHKLAGSAGTYGFNELGDEARDLEKRVQAADEPIPEDLLLDAVAFRRELEDTFEDARARLSGGKRQSLSAIRQKLVVAVIGGGFEDPVGEEQAHAVGLALARAGTHLVCGGLGGCMAAAARGYREGNGEGIVLGILPGASRHEANPWIDLPIPTGVGDAQSALVAMAVDGAIVVGGGGGTLSEIGLLLRDGKPVVALPHTGGAAEMVGGRKLYKREVVAASTPDDAVVKLLRALSERPNLAKR